MLTFVLVVHMTIIKLDHIFGENMKTRRNLSALMTERVWNYLRSDSEAEKRVLNKENTYQSEFNVP